MAKTDTLRVNIYLHALDRTGFGKEFNIRERRSHHQQSIATLQGILRRLGSKKPDAARGVRTVVRHRGLSEERFDNRRAESFCNLFQFLGTVQRALAGENRDFLAAIQDIGGMFDFAPRWNLIEIDWNF